MRFPLLVLHILGGTIGLLGGTFAISVRKGGRLHRASGNVFTIAMLTLASSGLCLAILKSQHGNIIGSIVTFYTHSDAQFHFTFIVANKPEIMDSFEFSKPVRLLG